MLCINTINTEENIMLSNVVIFFKYFFWKNKTKQTHLCKCFLYPPTSWAEFELLELAKQYMLTKLKTRLFFLTNETFTVWKYEA